MRRVEAWRASTWERRALWVVAVCVAAAAVAPIWRGRFLPLLDEPNHLASVFVWLEYNEPWARLKEFYRIEFAFAPYLLQYGVSYLFGSVAGVEIGHKLALCTYVLSLPVAALMWCRRTGRSPWLALLTVPLAYNYNWSYGFHPYTFGVAAFLFAVVALDTFLERPRVGNAIAAALLPMVCYVGHPLPLLALYVTLPVLWLSHRPRWTILLYSGAMMLPSASIVAWLSFSHGYTPTSNSASSSKPFIAGLRLPLSELARDLPTYALDSVSGNLDVAVFWVLAAAAIVAAAGSTLSRRLARTATTDRPAGWRGILLHYRSAWIGLAMLGLYVGLPIHLSRPFDWWLVGPRFAFVAAFFLFLAPAVPTRAPGRWFLIPMVPALAAVVFLPLLVSQKYADFNQRAAPMIRLVAMTRSDANILFLSMKPRGDPAVNVHAWNQGSSWVQVLHGGYSQSGFTHSIEGFPYGRTVQLPAPPWNAAEQFNPAVHAARYDYVLVRNQTVPVFPDNDPEFHLAAQEGAFALYERHARVEPRKSVTSGR